MEAAKRCSGTARVVRGAEVVQELSVGVLDGPGGEVCWPGMRAQACSISKLVMSIAVLKLAELRELHLQEPIARWVTVPPQWSAITLHQLLSHTSGLGHWGDVPGLPRLLTAPPPREELVALITRAPLVHSPGDAWCYSGPGYVFTSLVIEAATGGPYAEVATELVLAPAGMTQTTSGESLVGRAGVAMGHVGGDPQHLHPGFAAVDGSGDLWTTTADLIRLNQALRAGELLKPATAAQLWTAHAELNKTADAAAVIQMSAYGYGTFLGQINNRNARITPGDGPGYQTLLAYLPDQDLDIAILCNEDAPSIDAALDMLTSLR
ncbi:hypothetical protein GCM10009841_29140 [Microlunatus panaciterrae]|uniref:CubicO group peptidase (Beta-lactamase class C family) n=1 Tax=Microlunatus panaciterrae TaxID=400768 RepID=A0ABS2REZ2_9ACTN|nr:serine hydrolase domain-containing protein [Microlunatus panaciterrae]MBM7797574.1 CubicO group peptidase (beta-lactamase class C family) [Microlunatus panaciterrae]